MKTFSLYNLNTALYSGCFIAVTNHYKETASYFMKSTMGLVWQIAILSMTSTQNEEIPSPHEYVTHEKSLTLPVPNPD